MLSLKLLGFDLSVDIHYAHAEPVTTHANGSSELSWHLQNGTDEIGETISEKALDLIAHQFQSDIERAIWAQIGR